MRSTLRNLCSAARSAPRNPLRLFAYPSREGVSFSFSLSCRFAASSAANSAEQPLGLFLPRDGIGGAVERLEEAAALLAPTLPGIGGEDARQAAEHMTKSAASCGARRPSPSAAVRANRAPKVNRPGCWQVEFDGPAAPQTDGGASRRRRGRLGSSLAPDRAGDIMPCFIAHARWRQSRAMPETRRHSLSSCS